MIDRRRFLEVAAATGLSGRLVRKAEAKTNLAACEFDEAAIQTAARPTTPFLTEPGLRRRESRQPQTLYAQGRGSLEGPAHADDLAAGDRGRRIVRLARLVRLEDGTASTWPGSRNWASRTASST